MTRSEYIGNGIGNIGITEHAYLDRVDGKIFQYCLYLLPYDIGFDGLNGSYPLCVLCRNSRNCCRGIYPQCSTCLQVGLYPCASATVGAGNDKCCWITFHVTSVLRKGCNKKLEHRLCPRTLNVIKPKKYGYNNDYQFLRRHYPHQVHRV